MTGAARGTTTVEMLEGYRARDSGDVTVLGYGPGTLSGIFIPVGDNAPLWILWIARIFPVRHYADGMQAGFLGGPFHWSDLLIVARGLPGS